MSGPHNRKQDTAGMDIRDVRLIQVIHGGVSNWLVRPFAHISLPGKGFEPALKRSYRAPAPNCSQPLNLLTLEKGLANSLGLNLDDFNWRMKVHDHLAKLVLDFLTSHHESNTTAGDDSLRRDHELQRQHEILQAQLTAAHNHYGQG